MRTATMTFALTLLPTLLAGQSTSGEPDPMQGLSAEARIQAEATIQTALDQGLPDQPLYAVMLEGRAKGATEAQILTAEQQMLARLELAHEAIVQAGHAAPTGAEIVQGASLLSQGTSAAELSAAISQAPLSQALAVTFEMVGSEAGPNATSPVSGATGIDASTAVSAASPAGSLSASASATSAVTVGALGR